jgi:hypothetical protein
MLRACHGWNWGQRRRHLTASTGRWVIAADGVEFFRIEKVTASRYAYRLSSAYHRGRQIREQCSQAHRTYRLPIPSQISHSASAASLSPVRSPGAG